MQNAKTHTHTHTHTHVATPQTYVLSLRKKCRLQDGRQVSARVLSST